MAEHEKKRINARLNNNNLFAAVICGTILSIAVILIVSVLLSSISLKFRNPIRFSNILAIVSIILGGIFGGLISSAFYKNNPIVSSLISSLLTSIILIIIGLFGSDFNVSMMINPIILIAFSLTVALFAKGKNKKRKIRKYIGN